MEQSRALAACGHTVRIVANVNLSLKQTPWHYLAAHTRSRVLQMDGIEVVRREMRGVPRCLYYNSRKWVHTVMDMVNRYVAQYGCPDIIHAHCCKWAGYAAMRVCEELPVPYVITEHLPYDILSRELGPEGGEAWQVPYLKRAYKQAALVLPVAGELVESIASLVGTDYNWMEVSNTIDVDFFAYKERRLMENQPYTICCVADFVPRKGYDVLLPMVKRFMMLSGIPVRLLIAGKGTQSKAMKALVRQNGMEACTELHGKVDRYGVRDLLYRSHCFALATRSEVQPLVLLEAMSTGIPVVSTEVIPASERIRGGCFIGKTDDVESLAQQLYAAYQGGWDQGKALSQAIVALASPQVVGQELSMLFRQLVEQHCRNLSNRQ